MNKKANGLPPGFKPAPVGGDFAATHDFSKEKTVQGTVTGIDTVKTEDGPRRVMQVKKPDGVIAGVWENHALKGLFDTKGLKGKKVFIRHDGKKNFKDKKGKKKAVNMFTAGTY